MSNLFTPRKRIWIVSSLCFLILIVFALRDVLLTPGVVGHTWDWDIPTFTQQLWQQILRFTYVWDYQFRGGFYSPYRPEGMYWFIASPLSLFGSEVYSKVFPIILLFVAATSMRLLTSRVLNLNAFWSTVAGVLYMFSPYAYSRLMAGHMHMLSPYAVLPLLFLFSWQALHQQPSAKRLAWRPTIAAGLVLGYTGVHPSLLVIAGLIFGLLVLITLLTEHGFKRTLQTSFVIGVVMVLISAFWALPTGIGYLATGTIYHSGWPPQQPDQVTASAVMNQRIEMYGSTILPVEQALQQSAPSDWNDEYAYPVPDGLANIWLVASLLLPAAAFGYLLPRSQDTRPSLVLAILGLIGVTIITGTNILMGSVLNQWLLVHAFPIWAEFCNTLRALPMTAISFAALCPAFLQWLCQTTGKRWGIALGTLSTGVLVVCVSPFLTGAKIFDSLQLFPLRVYQSSAEDEALYHFMQADPEDARVTFVAPPWLHYAEYYDLGYEWFGGLSPYPEFFLPYYDPQSWYSAPHFQASTNGTVPGKLLGLGAVKYVIYPRDKFSHPLAQVTPKRTDALSNLDPSLDLTLSLQTNLTPVATPFTQTIVLRNENYLPRIYAASSSLLIHGEDASLADLANSSFFDTQPALLFDTQQFQGALQDLASRVDRQVAIGKTDQVATLGAQTSLLVPLEVFRDSTATFTTTTSMTSTIRVQAFPYQQISASPGDILSVTFEPVQPDPAVSWTGNAIFKHYGDPTLNGLIVAAYLDGSSREDEVVQMERRVDPIDLGQYPYLHLESMVENSSVQEIQIELGLDFGDGTTNAVWTSPSYSHAKLKADNVDVLEAVQREYPGKSQYHVASISVHYGKVHWADWVTPNYAHALYLKFRVHLRWT